MPNSRDGFSFQAWPAFRIARCATTGLDHHVMYKHTMVVQSAHVCIYIHTSYIALDCCFFVHTSKGDCVTHITCRVTSNLLSDLCLMQP